jgi:NADH-quinone oxidoreductase subunit N
MNLNINFSAILPEIILFVGAIFILMCDVFFAKRFKNFFLFSHLSAILICVSALFFCTQTFMIKEIHFNQMLSLSPIISLAKIILISLLTIVVLFSLKFVDSNKKISAEFLSLILISVCGSCLLVSANDFITFYLALELQGLPLYLLASINRNSEKSSEAGMKYFILGALASAILLFGVSLIYGYSSTTNFTEINSLYQSSQNPISVAVLFGFILVLVAMFFKIAAAPFHMWSPDVYQGSPEIVATFFATTAKFAVTFALISLLSTVALSWIGIAKIISTIALLSIIVGSLAAIAQKNIKRLLAYSSVAHIGFVLLALSTYNREGVGIAIFYLIIYSLISLGSFGFINLIKSNEQNSDNFSDDQNEKIFAISSLAGLSKTNPFAAAAFAILMFSTAGIPPMAGFFSKFYVIIAVLKTSQLWLAIAAILVSVIAALYYLRIVKIIYFDEVNQDSAIIEDHGNIKIIISLIALINIISIVFVDDLISIIINFL